MSANAVVRRHWRMVGVVAVLDATRARLPDQR